MKKNIFVLLIISFIVLLSFPYSSHARAHTVDEVHIESYIMPNGDLYVEELFTYTYDGKYNGPVRSIGKDQYGELDFFEAYEVDLNIELDNITEDNITPLDGVIDDEDFKVNLPVENERKRVFYRYRLKDVINKHSDIGELYFRFFDDLTDEDLHNIQISVHFYDNFIPLDQTYGFIHNLTNIDFEIDEIGLFYENDFLIEGETIAVRFLFPSELLSDMDQTTNENKLDKILKKEEKYKKDYNKRKKWLPILESSSDKIFWFFSFATLAAILYLPRILRLFLRPILNREIEDLDSFTMTALFKKMKLDYSDIQAMLFRLNQKDVLTIHYIDSPLNSDERENVIQKGENYFKFTLNPHHPPLQRSEQFLINWLFTEDEDGELSFSIKTFAGQWDEYRNQPDSFVANKQKEFKNQFEKWLDFLEFDDSLIEYFRPSRLRKIFDNVLIPFWIVWMNIYVWMINMNITLYTKVIFGICSAIVIFILKRRRTKRILTTVIVFLFLFFMPLVGFDDYLSDLYNVTVGFFLLSGFLPERYPTIKGIPYFKGVRRWRKKILENKYSFPENDEQLERSLQHALSLNVSDNFEANYGKENLYSNTANRELLKAPYDPLLLKRYIRHTQL